MILHVALAKEMIEIAEMDARRTAGRLRCERRIATRSPGAARRGLGWLLVEVGWRLAVPARD